MKSILARLQQNIGSREYKYIVAVIAAAIIITSIPYIYGFVIQGQDTRFLSLNTQAPADTNVYLSMIEEARQGHILLHNLFTSEPQKAAMFHPLWLILGWLGWLTHLPNIIIYHLARIFLIAIFLYIVYILISYFFQSIRKRQVAFMLITFSSGIGFLFYGMAMRFNINDAVLLVWPSDIWISESNTFLTLYHSPLFILSQILLVLILLCFVLWVEERERKYLITILVLVFFEGLMHPYDIITICAVLAAYILFRVFVERKKFIKEKLKFYFKKYLAVVLVSVPPAVYYLYLIFFIPAIGGWAKQNVDPSPNIQNYFIGYGLILFFAIFGLPRLLKTKNNLYYLLIAWLIANVILLYFPYLSVQRRLSNGFHIPLTILATLGLFECYDFFIAKRFKKGLKRTLFEALSVWILAFFFFGSTILVLVVRGIYRYEKRNPPYFITTAEAQAIDWLKPHTTYQDIILSHGFTGNVIPALTARRVYLGHGHQTLEWETKSKKVKEWFFNNKISESERKKFLIDNNISYLFYSDIERSLGDFNPAASDFLKPIYQNSEVTIYKVISI